MLKKAGVFLLWMALLAVLALLIWGVVLYQGWPLWYVPLIFVGIIGSVMVVRWVGRRWYAWRLRMRMSDERPENRADHAPNIDRDWTSGIRLLRQSRLSRLGSPLYVLPWFLTLGGSSSGKSSLLANSGLTSAMRSADLGNVVEPTDTLDWWFLERSVMIDPAGRVVEGHGSASAEWKRLLYWMLRSRRREPLNGVLLVIDSSRLLSDTDERLAELGRNLRQRLDDLVKVFGARLPVYFIITGADAVSGFSQWASALSPEQRKQPFGLLSQNTEHAAPAFLDEVFEGLCQRLSDLRIELGLSGLPDEHAFGLPERVADLRLRLDKLLLPVFGANPYSEPPLLRGLFLTAQGTDEQGRREGWFSHDLLGLLLPQQRHAYQPIDSWHRWRRLFAHLAVIVWLSACVGVAVLLVYAERHTSNVINDALSEPPKVAEFDGGLETDLDALRRFRQSIINMTDKEQGGWLSLLPFSRHISNVQSHYREEYVRLFNHEVREPMFDGVLSQNLGAALASGDSQQIAAYAEFLVRRINLLDARLSNSAMAEMPTPGLGLGLLYQIYAPKDKVSPSQMATVGSSYASYLAWDNDFAQLQSQRAALLGLLGSMGLESRPQTWLTAWAEQQSNLSPMRLSEYWSDNSNPDLELSSAYTLQGHNAILGFIEEIGRASRDQHLWERQRERFLSQYQEDTQNAWYQFIQRFLLSAQTRLEGQSDWQQALSVVGTANDPFLKLLHRTAKRFELIPVSQRSSWAASAVNIDRLLKLAKNNDLHSEIGALNNLKVTNSLGGDVLKGLANGDSVSEGVNQVRQDLAQARSLAQFQQLIRDIVGDLQKSDAQAFQVALDGWGYGSDPSVKASKLWQAWAARDKLIQELRGLDPREDVVWGLATGSLDFSVHYAGQIAACQLQRDWNGQLLSAINGVQDPVIINEQLYGDRGQLPAFMNGPVKTFVERDAQRYAPREALGVNVPLTGAFYSYVSRMQHAQNDIASAKRQSLAMKAAQEQEKQSLGIEQKALQAQQVELQQKLVLMQATAAVVELSATPSQVNLSARQLPQQTRLTMQCNGRSTVLENYNFPTSASFVWAPGNCTDVALEVVFSDFKLVRHWTGPQAFVEFLRNFSGGQHTFTPDDFPNQRDIMGSENLTQIQLTYRQQGEKTLLDNYAQADQLQMQITEINDRLKSIDEELASIDTQAAAQAVSVAASGSPEQQGLASIQPPKQIAWCWTHSSGEIARKVVDSLRIEVGVFNNETRLKELETHLREMNYETRRELVKTPGGQPFQRLLVVGLADNAAAQKALTEISVKLNVQGRIDRGVNALLNGSAQ
ncbi:type VI secretion system protein [Pseudomonas sp. EA_65y_Pfl1_P113]|uniref:type VI secretion system protein n=1 Tax=Pseudomonas sp. EA_65y_Pfl1_P113 TaxID=3088692 RepID=UPI0030D8931D